MRKRRHCEQQRDRHAYDGHEDHKGVAPRTRRHSNSRARRGYPCLLYVNAFLHCFPVPCRAPRIEILPPTRDFLHLSLRQRRVSPLLAKHAESYPAFPRLSSPERVSSRFPRFFELPPTARNASSDCRNVSQPRVPRRFRARSSCKGTAARNDSLLPDLYATKSHVDLTFSRRGGEARKLSS